ncbi:MAG TPA: GNAT family N-acetyltransferase [Candidatus Solibacter sp.]|nr:GNAT family N-acetyltransferase [Candidatus Solibacter sp.]
MIREATLGDRPGIREMRRRVWHTTYGDTWPAEAIDDLFDGNIELVTEHPQSWTAPFINLVAHVDGEIVGAAASGVLPDGEGELVSLNVLSAHHGTGVAQQLWAATISALRARGCASMQIWVVETNARARRFYEKHGAAVFASGSASLGGIAAREVCYRFVFT